MPLSFSTIALQPNRFAEGVGTTRRVVMRVAGRARGVFSRDAVGLRPGKTFLCKSAHSGSTSGCPSQRCDLRRSSFRSAV